MHDVFDKIAEVGIVPVIRLELASDALPLGRALLEGGLPVAEVTFRTDAAAESIAILRRQCPGLLVGAGTVLTIAQAEAAIAAGASFAVTPGFNPRIVDFCIAKGLPIVPGVNSPSQVEEALERGLTLLKFFPAEASGGTRMIKALGGPYGMVTFVPTGGIDAANAASYLSLSNVAAVGGTWMLREELIAAGSFGEIARLAADAVELARKARRTETR